MDISFREPCDDARQAEVFSERDGALIQRPDWTLWKEGAVE